MDRRTFLATSIVSGASLAALGHLSKVKTATAQRPNFITVQASQEPVVLITGTSSGIGKASAIAFARQGYNVIATMRRVKERNAKAARELTTLAKNENLTLSVVEIDVNDDRSVENGVNQAAQLTGGRIDVLVNNAGIYVPLPIELMPPEAVYDTYNTNILGCHRMARAVLPYMRERNDGLIIQISSGGGRLTFPLLGAYCSSKFTLESLSDAMHYELAPMGIDVVVIQPDDTESEILNNGRRYVEEIMKTISSDSQRLDAYKEHLKLMDYALSAEDVPVAAEVVATEIVKSASTQKGQRPNRVCLSGQLVVDINTLMQNAQKEVISGTPYAPWQTLRV
jgi:NAD(P)-dependent dehydrogenase (short-subunit alcohol dehydrogenase family)